MSKTLWLQPDDLNPDVLASERWDDVVYLFDPEWLAKRPHSLKQIHFICEALASLPTYVTVYRGNPLDVLTADGQTAAQVSIVEPRDIELRDHLSQLTSAIDIRWLPKTTWIRPPDQSFNRFFKFWNAVKKQI